MKKQLILAMSAVVLIAVTFVLCNHVSHHNAYVSTSATSIPTATVTVTPPRPLTAKEQQFITEACADAANQSMYATCEQAVIASWHDAN